LGKLRQKTGVAQKKRHPAIERRGGEEAVLKTKLRRITRLSKMWRSGRGVVREGGLEKKTWGNK